MNNTTSTPDLSNLSPEFLAADNHEKLLKISIAFIVLTTVTYFLFNVSRIYCAERNHWETWVLYPISYFFQLLLGILCILFVQLGGVGRHIQYWELYDPSVVDANMKIQTATDFIYPAGVTLPKVCILMLYLRIFIERKVIVATKIVIAVIIASWFGTGIIFNLAVCQPIAYRWDKSIPGGHCADIVDAYPWASLPNIVTDLAVILLPLSSIYGLRMSRANRIGIFLTFLAGGLGIITAIIRFLEFLATNPKDLTYASLDPDIYTLVEPNVYFICSCLPGIRPLHRHLAQKSTATVNKYRNTLKYDSGTTRCDEHAIPLEPPRGSYRTSASTSRDVRPGSAHNSASGLFLTNTSYHVVSSHV